MLYNPDLVELKNIFKDVIKEDKKTLTFAHSFVSKLESPLPLILLGKDPMDTILEALDNNNEEASNMARSIDLLLNGVNDIEPLLVTLFSSPFTWLHENNNDSVIVELCKKYPIIIYLRLVELLRFV